jgi:hypothetical protein
MGTTRFETVNEIINQVASECGLLPIADVFFTSDPAFKQLAYLLTSCGRDLVEEYPWNRVVRTHTITVAPSDDGKYALPSDFAYMINQTGWNKSLGERLGGPAGDQIWANIVADETVAPVYISFHFREGQLWVWPQPPATGTEITFDYASRGWALAASDGTTLVDRVSDGADIVLLEPTLITKMLKKRFLQAKGFDFAEAESEFKRALGLKKSHDKDAPILSLIGGRKQRLLDTDNIPDSSYGT